MTRFCQPRTRMFTSTYCVHFSVSIAEADISQSFIFFLQQEGSRNDGVVYFRQMLNLARFKRQEVKHFTVHYQMTFWNKIIKSINLITCATERVYICSLLRFYYFFHLSPVFIKLRNTTFKFTPSKIKIAQADRALLLSFLFCYNSATLILSNSLYTSPVCL